MPSTSSASPSRQEFETAYRSPMTCLVVHLLPYDGIGGVEVAARSVAPGHYGSFSFRKAFIATKTSNAVEPGVYRTNVRSENSPLATIVIARHLIAARPNVLILSLWRSCIVGLIVKLIRPRTRLVLFLHNNVDSHRIDSWTTRLTARFAHAIWADSNATARARLPHSRVPLRTISFLTERFARLPTTGCQPAFVWWGRLHPRKRVNDAIAFIDRLRRRHAGVRFTVIGPDGGSEAALRRQVRELNLTDIVTFHGPADHAELRHVVGGHSFYLQMSEAEGMSMSTVEAMQFGLVPVVTPVGEIAAYVVPQTSGIWVRDQDRAIEEVSALIIDDDQFHRMAEAAAQVWADRALYREDFISACEEALKP